MPHTAVDNNVPATGSARVRYATYWYQNPPWTNYGDVNSYSWVSYPASVSNPVRSDGTRAPSAYFIKRVFVSLPPKRGVMSNWPTPPPAAYNYLKDSVAIPKAGQLLGKSKTDYDVFLPKSAVVTSVDSRARTNFLNKLARASGKDQVQLGVALGEFRETVDMAVHLAKATARGITEVARATSQPGRAIGRFLDALGHYGPNDRRTILLKGDLRAPDYVVEAWLTYQLGLKPLAHDLYDGLVWAQAAQASEGAFPATVRSGADDSYDEWHLMHNKAHQGAPYSVDALMRKTVGVHYSCVYKVPTRASIPEQLGLWNPASVAWNLVRYTWVVDYISNTGMWLNSMLAADGTRFVEGTRSVILRSSSIDWRFRELTRPWTVEPRLDDQVVVVESFRRDVLTSGVMPSLLPSLKNRVNLTRLANVVALVTAQAGRRQWRPPIL